MTLVHAAEHLLGRDEPYAGEEVAAALRGRFGVDVRLGTEAEAVRQGGAGVIVDLKGGGAVRMAVMRRSSAQHPTPLMTRVRPR